SITGGADQSLFNMTSGGALSFTTPPDFEAPGDAGGTNTYEVQVTATDGFGGTAIQNLTVTVTDVADAPLIDLDLGGPQTITWIKKSPPVAVLPQVTVSVS